MMIKKLIFLFLLVPSICFAAAPTRQFSYIAHTTIDPTKNNANENALYTYLQNGVDTYSAGTISNTAISGTAAIAYSKLNLLGSILNSDISSSAAIGYSKLNLTGGIVNADVSGSAAIVASKLDLTSPGGIGTTTPGSIKSTTLEATSTLKLGTTHQGDILYDNGTSLVRLTPGTSGQFLETLGASANPAWATVPILSNVLFQYAAQVDLRSTTSDGEVNATTLTNVNTTTNYRYLSVHASSLATVYSTKWKKISGISTITIYAQQWENGAAASTLKVNVGTANTSNTDTGGINTPTWINFTIDVSGLSDGTVYDVTAQLSVNNGTQNAYLGNFIAFGS